jgi:multidrug efflux pump subunit AcrA (membrane-fusion protein)
MSAKLYLFYFIGFIVLSSCHSSEPEAEAEAEPQTPVTVTTVGLEDMNEYTELNATSTFMEKSVVKAGMNGYIQSSAAVKGKYVKAGETLFTIITREAKAIGNSINKLDPDFKFTGISAVKAAKSGYISDLNHQKGDFVPEGEQLAIISNNNSLVFLMDVPYELNRDVRKQKSVSVNLPDGEILNGVLSASLPSVDSLSQTQRIIIKVNPGHLIPENLVAKVRIIHQFHPNAASLPRGAVLANETQDIFWVMKLLNDSTAVKTPVTRGIETKDRVEILKPIFKAGDRIVVTGNYGLADTAKIKIAAN